MPPRFERFDAAAALRTTLRPIDLAEEVGGAVPLCPGIMFAEEAAGDGARLRLWNEEVSEHVEYRLPVIELASEKEMGLGFASNGMPI